jgi:opacity protein-like surface antigen
VSPRTLLAALALVLLPSAALADLTAFVGVTPTPVNRPARGIALGVSLLLVGFEVEYADTAEDVAARAPALRTGMFNALAQTPVPLGGVNFYATAGIGVYRERIATEQHTHVGANIGGGVKVALAGPLRLRLDYRVFTLGGPARVGRPQRIYAGVNLRF